ncbi:hypothetical protein BKA93DRAFT_751008 [Sparassis latifolia]
MSFPQIRAKIEGYTLRVWYPYPYSYPWSRVAPEPPLIPSLPAVLSILNATIVAPPVTPQVNATRRPIPLAPQTIHIRLMLTASTSVRITRARAHMSPIMTSPGLPLATIAEDTSEVTVAAAAKKEAPATEVDPQALPHADLGTRGAKFAICPSYCRSISVDSSAAHCGAHKVGEPEGIDESEELGGPVAPKGRQASDRRCEMQPRSARGWRVITFDLPVAAVLTVVLGAGCIVICISFEGSGDSRKRVPGRRFSTRAARGSSFSTSEVDPPSSSLASEAAVMVSCGGLGKRRDATGSAEQGYTSGYFEAYPYPYPPRVVIPSKGTRQLAAITNITSIAQFYGSPNPRVGTPTPASPLTSNPNLASLGFLLYQISDEMKRRMLDQFCISMPSLTIFVYDLTWELPRYICAFSGFMTMDESELLDIMDMHLHEDESIEMLLDIIGHDENGAARGEEILQSLEISILDLHSTGSFPAPAVNVYMTPPNNELSDWLKWRDFIFRKVYSITFSGCSIGHPGFKCTGCHDADHPRGLCPFKHIPGWLGPVLVNSGNGRGPGPAPSPGSAPIGLKRPDYDGFLQSNACTAMTTHTQTPTPSVESNSHGMRLHQPRGDYSSPTRNVPEDGPVEIDGGDCLFPSEPPHPATNITTTINATSGAAHTWAKKNHKKKSKKRNGKNTKASLCIASLNICGRGSSTPDAPTNKWSAINQLLRERKISVLTVQETHLDDEHTERLHPMFGKCLLILSSPSPNATSVQGLAFVLNKEITNTDDAHVTEIIPGRALLLTLQCSESAYSSSPPHPLMQPVHKESPSC